MTSEERDLITGLFHRLSSADTQPHDPDADKLIRESVTNQPGAPYQFVQTLLVQEHALLNAQVRIKALEQALASATAAQSQAQSQPHGFLSGLFGAAPKPAPANIAPQSLPPAPSTPYPSTVNMPASAGGGFLRSALTTAAGVAGGEMLFQGIEDLLGHRSGAFGAGLGGGGGFMDTGFGGRPETVETINNYYGDSGSQGAGNDTVQDAGNFQDPNPNLGNDDFPASVDLNYDTSANDATDAFGSSDDTFADSGSGDYSSDDSSSV